MQIRNRENPELIDSETWICLKCIMEERLEYSPFIYQSNNQLCNLNALDSMNLFDMLPDDNIFTVALQTNCLNTNDDDDVDESNIENINSKYFSCEEFFNHDNSNAFNILHSNVNGFISHADNINEFLAHPKKTEFDAICITETSLKDVDIPENALPHGYEPFSTKTLSSKGGVTIFVKNTHDYFERDDLRVQRKEFEAVWIEINNSRNKNMVVGCIYRHPHYQNLEDFSEYMNATFTRLNKEKKEVYIAGDFNIDLLKYESNAKCRDFYNLVTSYGYLPLITQPSRFCDTTQSLIDNVCINTFVHDSESGNILIEFADHLTQFVSIKKDILASNKEPVYKLDQSKFDEKLFLGDLSIQNFVVTEDPSVKFSDMLWKYESCVKRHMPLKK